MHRRLPTVAAERTRPGPTFRIQVGCASPQLSATGDARMLRSTKTQIDRRFRAIGRDQAQARSCRPRPDIGGRKHAHVALRRAATSCDVSGVKHALLGATRRRLDADHLPSTPERSCRQRSCDRSVAVRRRRAHVASDPAILKRYRLRLYNQSYWFSR